MREAEIIVDILDTDESIDAAFEVVEHFAGSSWLDDNTQGLSDFTIRETKETKFLRRAFFEQRFTTEDEVMEAVRRYSGAYKK